MFTTPLIEPTYTMLILNVTFSPFKGASSFMKFAVNAIAISLAGAGLRVWILKLPEAPLADSFHFRWPECVYRTRGHRNRSPELSEEDDTRHFRRCQDRRGTPPDFPMCTGLNKLAHY